MRGSRAGFCLLWVLTLSWQGVLAEYRGGGKPVDDFASYKIRTIGLVVIGRWKGSDAKVDPIAIASAVKGRLREMGYEINDVRNKKHLKAVQKSVDAILTIKYEAMISQENFFPLEDKPGWGVKQVDRLIRGTAEMVTTKRITKRKKTVFRAKGQTAKQAQDAGDGKHVRIGNPVQEFSAIVADLPPVPDQKKRVPPAEGEKKGEKEEGEKGEKDGKKDK